MKLLTTKENDDSNFITNCEYIVQQRIELWKPTNVFITRIDNWFDEKWMCFSGKINTNVSIWKGETTIPPFHPNRVESCNFHKKTAEIYTKKELPKPLHIFQNSTDNLNRYISDVTNDGLFIWYSGNSKKNEIGSLMCYWIKNSECFPFFITLSKKKDWNVSRTKGFYLKID